MINKKTKTEEFVVSEEVDIRELNKQRDAINKAVATLAVKIGKDNWQGTDMHQFHVCAEFLRKEFNIHAWVRAQRDNDRNGIYVGEIKSFHKGKEFYTRTKHFRIYEECLIFSMNKAIDLAMMRDQEEKEDSKKVFG